MKLKINSIHLNAKVKSDYFTECNFIKGWNWEGCNHLIDIHLPDKET